MSDLHIDIMDSAYITIDCNRGIAKELAEFFTFYVPNFKFMPAYRSKVWDGKIKLYNVYTQTLYAGLYDCVIHFAKVRNYSVSEPDMAVIPPPNINTSTVTKFVNEHLRPSIGGKMIKAREHQINAITHSINQSRSLIVSPTGSGKSLIIYALMRYYLSKIPNNKKVLIVVPTTSLVYQMLGDFNDYSSQVEWNADNECHIIMAGKNKTTTKRVVITTWQSIYKMHTPWFDQFHCVFGDEAHLYKSKSLVSILTKLKQCHYRFGTTGTLDGSLTHKLVLEGLFGTVNHVTTTKKLMDKKILSDLKIDTLVLSYPDAERKLICRSKYHDEIQWIIANEHRNNFITDLAINLKGNTLLLFQYVENHGIPLHAMLKDKIDDPNRPLFFISGKTDTEYREYVRKITETESNAIIVASMGTFSTGISIRKLHNIIFASPSKSRIRVLQSIGRQLRTSKDKVIARLFDIGDDLKWKSQKNYSLKHLNERIKIYDSENFKYAIKRINLYKDQS